MSGPSEARAGLTDGSLAHDLDDPANPAAPREWRD